MRDPVARIGKVIVKHLPIDEDLIGGIKKICVDNGIRCGQILTVVGSIRHLSIECIVVNSETESGFDFGPPRVISGPMQILSLVGIIFENEAGKMDTHIHGTFSDSDGNIYGGHVLEGENPVAVRLTIAIGEIADVCLTEKKDSESGHLIMQVKQQKSLD